MRPSSTFSRVVAIALVLVSTLALGMSRAVDLSLRNLWMGFTVNGSGTAEGGTATFSSYLVSNPGPDPASNISIGLYVSIDNQITTADTPVWSGSVANLAAGASQLMPAVTVSLPAALVAGSYWFGAIVDDNAAIAESDETNNVLVGSNRLVVLAPVMADLRVDLSGIENTRFVVGAGDAYNTDFFTSGGPVLVAPEGNLVFHYRIGNGGPEDSPGFTVRYYLSTDATITASDTYLGQRQVDGVASGMSIVADLNSYALPASVVPGSYFAGVMIDANNQVIEQSGVNPEGNNVQLRSVRVLDLPPESTPIWRLRIYLETGDVDDAATDDDVYVKLGDETFWLDYARNDFQRDDGFTYDLVLDDVERFRDLSSLEIGKEGQNGWCLDKLSFQVNDRMFFGHDFPGACRWLDGSNRSVDFLYGQLRSSGTWGDPSFPSFDYTADDISRYVQALVGDQIHDSELKWGHYHGSPVEVTPHGATGVKVDLDMYADVFGPDPDVDIDFVITFGCDCSGLGIEVSDVHVDASSWAYPGFVEEMINEALERELGEQLKSFGATISLGVDFCPTITVESDADVVFGIPASVRDMAIVSTHPGLVRPGQIVDLQYRVTNIGNASPGPYSVLSELLTDGGSPFMLVNASGQEVRPCDAPERRWSRSVSLPPTLSCNTFANVRFQNATVTGPTRGELRLPVRDGFRTPVTHVAPEYSIRSTIVPDAADADAANDVTARRLNVAGPEINFASLTTPSSSVRRGTYVRLGGTLANRGAFATGPLTLSVALVPASGAPIPILNATLASFAAGAGYRWTDLRLPVPAAAAPGNYTLVAKVNPAATVKECGTDVNERSLTITVTP